MCSMGLFYTVEDDDVDELIVEPEPEPGVEIPLPPVKELLVPLTGV